MSINNTWDDFFTQWSLIKTIKLQEIFLEKILKYTTSKDVLLELGTGSGHSSIALSFSNRKIIASDINDELLRKIQENNNLRKKNIDMFNICKREEIVVDCVFHQGLLEHFSDEEIILSLKEQAKVAKYIVFDIPNNKRFKKIKEFGNERFLSIKKWKKLIKEADLEIVEVSGRRFCVIFDFLPCVIKKMEWFRRVFGTSSIFICRKKNDNICNNFSM